MPGAAAHNVTLHDAALRVASSLGPGRGDGASLGLLPEASFPRSWHSGRVPAACTLANPHPPLGWAVPFRYISFIAYIYFEVYIVKYIYTYRFALCTWRMSLPLFDSRERSLVELLMFAML